MSNLSPKFEEISSIYDISNAFYELFLGPTMGYTCGYFEREDASADEAQISKFDLALGKLGLEPGMTLLDVGCGWGAGMQRAIEKYDVNVIGLTLSDEQRKYAIDKLGKVPTRRTIDIRLQGWEEFHTKVDRIVSIGAFEHFGFERYDDFFTMAWNILPDDGVLLLHTITAFDERRVQELGLPLTFELARFAKFIMTEIFPGGRLPSVRKVEHHAQKAGFTVGRLHEIGPHYVKTLQCWAERLRAHRDEAIALQGREVYERFDKYLNGCVDLFRAGYTSVHQFTLTKNGPNIDPFPMAR
ncbi:Mycolic acid synthase UmaA [Mycobacteroides abscessus subsp. massiliense]|uniref:cyclopropane mycolic acid synthase family methyltransferase n=1 Tax=Mycobacteroides abscessus TaxID=36809 RepID=UPI0002EF391F|nr:cyclopropane mycolic acid synthase family methyltransferase [Mycobacteroides abscessus]AMU77302.1 SAM-dependent methyltransferase [Mycobacteroides abscessus]ANO26247.1 SAM-dependent methyltransferase [Mycobacteroides abscessus]MBN7320199.1 class I SAM-dependent methyltransferase [Mycobacteroides abscessus subsp. massiliense]RIU33763.1 methyltransferase domain-containing protein [Mycobacteroides abscessus]SLG90187.1 Mycolic acid synthase UmaA [Mycobacteroides abscessus subsp. massiliense]